MAELRGVARFVTFSTKRVNLGGKVSQYDSRGSVKFHCGASDCTVKCRLAEWLYSKVSPSISIKN